VFGGSVRAKPLDIKKRINSAPKKGVSNLLKALKKDLGNLAGSGPVFAVIDRDKIHEHLDPRPTNCMTGIRNHILGQAQAECDVVFMVENIESLIDASCEAMAIERPSKKPTPDERDRYCARLVWNGTQTTRAAALALCPSFARLVERVAKLI
jgi:hypothetical protein